jgi:uncharacterized iron-regulated membrane protein
VRPLFTFLHRWAGLVMAAFLFVSGVTGAVISWDHELDELLNPHLTQARAAGTALPALELAQRIEARHPQVAVTFVPMAAPPGQSLAFGVSPRVDAATGRLHEARFNQVFVDPASGDELGRREWGAVWPITRETFVSFLYKFHYSLHIPAFWGIDRWGEWLLGAIAVLWTLDCFVGAYLTLPARRRTAGEAVRTSWWQRWMPAWRVRTGAGTHKLNFDLHRAGGLWAWGLLFILAFTAFSLNLYREVFYPLLSQVSQVTPGPFELRTPSPPERPVVARLGYAHVIAAAETEARRRGWPEPVGSVFYSPDYGVYGVQFYRPEDDHGAGGVGHKRLYYDGLDGRYVGDRIPWSGTVADIFVQAQFPLHSGRILGLPGRILISLMGIVVAMLSVTGVYLWWKKRRARVSAAPQAWTRPAAWRTSSSASGISRNAVRKSSMR